MHSSAFKWNFQKINVLSLKAGGGGGDIQFGFGPELGSFYKEPPESQMSSKLMPRVSWLGWELGHGTHFYDALHKPSLWDQSPRPGAGKLP